MLRVIKNSAAYLIGIFSAIALLVFIALELFQTTYDRTTKLNAFISYNADAFQILEAEDIPQSSLEPLVKLDGITAFYKVFPYSDVKAVWYNNEVPQSPSLLSGRFFSLEDMESHRKVAVIGKDITMQCLEENGVLWFEHEKTRYEVIGVLGEENKSSNLDDLILISFAPYLDDDVRFHYNGEYILDHEASRKIYDNVHDYIIKLDSNAIIKKVALDEYVPSLFAVFMKSQILSQILLSLAIVLALNIVNISVYWVTARKKKMGVKKMLGASNSRLALEIILEYQIMTFLGFMLGWILYQWIRTLPMMSMIRGENSIHLLYILIAYVICSFVGLITALIPANRVIHLQPSDSIKG